MSLRLTGPVVGALAALVACGQLVGAQADAREWFEPDAKALASIELEGLPLPTSVEQLEWQFPGAKHRPDRVGEQIGLVCYEVDDSRSADLARFYFFDGRLYQVELAYELPRIKEMGGMQALVQKLIDTLGPADHVGERRWTWQRAMYQRRADFYTWPDRAQLTISDTSLMPIVAARLKRHDERQGLDLGL